MTKGLAWVIERGKMLWEDFPPERLRECSAFEGRRDESFPPASNEVRVFLFFPYE
jgi:hypothetical protein